MSEFEDKLNVEGFVTVVKNGEQILSQKNLITDAGKDWIIRRLIGSETKARSDNSSYLRDVMMFEAGLIDTHPSTRPEDQTRNYTPQNFPSPSAELTYHGESYTNIERVYLGTGTTEPAASDTFVETEATWNSYIDLHHGWASNSSLRSDLPSANTFARISNIGAATENQFLGVPYYGFQHREPETYYRISKYAGQTNDSNDYQPIAPSDQILRFHYDFTSNANSLIFPYVVYNSDESSELDARRDVGFSNVAVTGSGGSATYSEKSASPIFGDMPYLTIRSGVDGQTQIEHIKLLYVQGTGVRPKYLVCLRGQLGTTAKSWSAGLEPYVDVYVNDSPGAPQELVHKFVYSKSQTVSENVSVPDSDAPITEAALCFQKRVKTGPDWTNPQNDPTVQSWQAFSRVKFAQPWTRTNLDDIEIYWTIRIS